LSAASQVKLLRLIQEREYYPLGSDQPKQLRARVLAATHCPTSALRPDLYYRLRSYRVEIPPLRQRPGDLPLLLDHFLEAAAADLGRPKPKISEDLLFHLGRYPFPGNVRELRSMCFDALARQPGEELQVEPFLDLMETPAVPAAEAVAPSEPDRSADASPAPVGRRRVISRAEWRRLERENLLEALLQCGWQIAGKDGAAELLGMASSTLESRMKALDIQRP
ncbi:MAG: sigma-54-dependent Fis family transcriptional regulator, partial [Acidobacteria bacterium]|nr:sigma-54-dependent Fis family transcriptional regulator [Acidobacteriota bacterium]